MTQSLPKMLWLLEHEPETVLHAHKIVDVQAFLVHRLTGHFRTSLASADPMGLVDIINRRWAADLIQALGLNLSQFADVAEPGAILGKVTANAARVTGLAEGLAGQRMQWPEHGMPDYLLLVGAMLCPNRDVAETLAL